MKREPHFLDLEQVNLLHDRSLRAHGGLAGIRNQGGLEAAVNQPLNVFHYLDGDLFEIAAAYAYHLAESQAYIDGNKRTAVAAALVFLAGNGVTITGVEPMLLYLPMMEIAAGTLDREGLAKIMRGLFT